MLLALAQDSAGEFMSHNNYGHAMHPQHLHPVQAAYDTQSVGTRSLLPLLTCCCFGAAAAVDCCALLKLKPLLPLDLSLTVLLSGKKLATDDDDAAAFASVSGLSRPSTTSPPSAVRAAMTPGLQQHASTTEQRIMLRIVQGLTMKASVLQDRRMHAAGQCYTDQLP
jgi:hypothetical protein